MMTTPLFALVGRPNVGKSTIFNMLTRTRNALVADVPGLTRDRQYGRSYYASPQGEVFPYILLDTGGISGVEETIDTLIETQVWKAVDEADIVFFVVDGREGLTPFDEAIAERLRRTNKLTVVLVNKAEGQEADLFASDFYRLGFSHLFVISATHNRGFSQLLTGVFSLLKEEGWYPKEEKNLEQLADNRVKVETEESAIRLVVFGRPNAGKSTLINHLIGEERLLTSEVAGTTRDSIEIPFRYKAQDFILIDTAGVRRRARVSDKIEKFSVIKSLNAIESAHVILFLFDGEAGLSEQDATLLGYALDAGKALILAVNKWDILEEDEKSWLRQDFTRRYAFIDFTTPLFISALTGRGVNRLLDEAIKAYHSAMEEFSTSYITRILEEALIKHPPPIDKGFAPKLRFAHQGGKNPLTIVIHGNRTHHVKEDYIRYLSKTYREALGLYKTPVKILFRSSENPYADKGPSPTKKELKRAPKKRYGQT